MELETGVCTAAVTGEDVLGEGRGGEGGRRKEGRRRRGRGKVWRRLEEYNYT